MAKKKAVPRERGSLTDRQRRELRRLRDMPDSEIDLSDAPPARPLPSDIEVGRRLDADVLAWFRSRGKKYQTYMNEVLRREMQTRPRGR
jgi:uncharacterized protein (DUF4415 family)